MVRASAAVSTDGIDAKLMKLQQELLKKANNKEAYDEIADEIFRLREKREHTDLAEFDEALVKRWFKQITVWEGHFTVELKSGLSIDVEG